MVHFFPEIPDDAENLERAEMDEAEWEARLAALEAESSLQPPFEHGLTSVVELEALEEEFVEEDEWCDEKADLAEEQPAGLPIDNSLDQQEIGNGTEWGADSSSKLEDEARDDFEHDFEGDWVREINETELNDEEVIVLPNREADGTASRGPSVSSLHMRKTGGASKSLPVRARILWPALGFPAVIAPTEQLPASQMLDCDASRCICVLLVSNRPYLSKEEAARCLRYVPWAARDRRHIPAGQTGSFADADIAVRNDVNEPKLTLPGWSDSFAAGLAFGGNREGENGIIVGLAHYVRNFYRKQGLEYLHEIRVSEEASGRLQAGLYHLFWNNEDPSEKEPSDEMALLLRHFARPRRETLTELWEQYDKLLAEYEYEYGVDHLPYRSELAMRRPRTEILHPLFVQRPLARSIKIGHITDTHVDVRADVYAENLKDVYVEDRTRKKVRPPYNNWNRSFERVYNDAKRDSDVLLLTGDLIDYGRGHWGVEAANQLGEDRLYHVDRNWFLFYYLLASNDAYQKPVYTTLGNHDWRLNPYPPFAIAGAPRSELLINDHAKFKKKDLTQILQRAHGPGYERKFSYHLATDEDFIRSFWESGKLLKTIARMLAQKRTLDEPHLPVETSIESVAWYLLAINPFLDYSFSLPGGHKIMMLDWAEDEDLLFPIVQHGKRYPYMLWQAGTAADPGPKARNCLTNLQLRFVEDFIAAAGNAKIVGLHAPPIGPYPDWYDYPDLFTERKIYGHGEKARGPIDLFATRKADGSIEKWTGHPIFAVRPSSYGAFSGTVADYGSFQKNRLWFIKKMAEPKSGVRIILSGHIHRNGLFVVRVAGKKEGPAIAGKMLVKGLLPRIGVSEKVALGFRRFPYSFPIYINTTSAGPRGNFNNRQLTKEEKEKGGLTVDPGYALIELVADGTIESVEFRFPQATRSQPPSLVTPQPEAVAVADGAAAQRIDLTALETETPFQSVFEQGRMNLIEPEQFVAEGKKDTEIGEVDWDEGEADWGEVIAEWVESADSELAGEAPMPVQTHLQRVMARSELPAVHSPRDLYHAFVGGVPQGLARLFDVVAMPGSVLGDRLRPGDLLLRRIPEDGYVHLAFLASDDLLPPQQALGRGWTLETLRPGYYTLVVEAGPRPHRAAHHYARRVLDGRGLLPPNHLVLRLQTARRAGPMLAFEEADDFLRPCLDCPDAAEDLSALAHTCQPGEGPPAPEPDPTGRGLHPLLIRGISTTHSRRPSVGYAQQCLNNFLTQLTSGSHTCQNQVAEAQQFIATNLAALRRANSLPLAVDCRFGEHTQQATRIFQACMGLARDGKIGPRTWSLLQTFAPAAPPITGLNPARWNSIMASPELHTGNFVNFLIDGQTTFREMRHAILTATGEGHYIYLLGWWLCDDFPLVPALPGVTPPPPLSIRDLFASRAVSGVQIRAMLWDQALSTQNDAEVARINARPNGGAILDGHTFSSFSLANAGSHHQKVLIVKGSEGLITFCGGIDLNLDRIHDMTTPTTHCGGSGSSSGSSSSCSGGQGSPLHDVHCRIVGPSAWDLLDTFIRRWDAHPGHGAIDTTKGALLGRSEARPVPLAPLTIASGSIGGNCAVRVTRTYNPVTPLAAGTTAVRERSIRETLIMAIQNARRFIYMEDQYLVNMEAAALLNAALSRIQHLTILIAASQISDMPRRWAARLDFINRLTRGPHGHKARVFFLSTPPNTAGTTPVFGRHTYVHAKIWVFDDELAVIGSANCNQRGWTHDSEVNAVIFEDVNPSGETFAQRLRMQLWAEHLNVSPAAVRDGVTSAVLWTAPPPGARIRPYDPRADTDPLTDALIPMGAIDPAGPP